MYEKSSVNQSIIINELIANKYVDDLIKLKNYKKGIEINLKDDNYIGFLKNGAVAESNYDFFLIKSKKEFINLSMLFSKYNKKSDYKIVNITDSEILWVNKSYFRDYLSVNPLFMEVLTEEITEIYLESIKKKFESPENIEYLEYMERVLKNLFYNLDTQLEISLDVLFEVCKIPNNEQIRILNFFRKKGIIEINPSGCVRIKKFKDITIG